METFSENQMRNYTCKTKAGHTASFKYFHDAKDSEVIDRARSINSDFRAYHPRDIHIADRGDKTTPQKSIAD